MANLSNYRANFIDIGGVAMYHQDVTAPLLTVNGKDYLRSGQFIPYQTKYAEAAAKGLGVSGRVDTYANFGGVYNPAQGSTPSCPNNWLAYAAGKLCRISPIMDQSTPYDILYTYSVAPVDGTILDGPSLLNLPTHEEVGLLRPAIPGGMISPPFYLSDSGKWACVAISQSASLDDNTAAGDYEFAYIVPILLTSADGLYWTNSGACGGITRVGTVLSMYVVATQINNVVNTLVKYYTTGINATGFTATTSTSGKVVSFDDSGGITQVGGPASANMVNNNGHFFASLSPSLTYGIFGVSSTQVQLRVVDGNSCNNNILDLPSNYTSLAAVQILVSSAGSNYPNGLVLMSDGVSAVIAGVNQETTAPTNNVAFIPSLSSPTSGVVYSTINLTGVGTVIEGYPRADGSYIIKVIKAGVDTYTYSVSSAGVVAEYAAARTVGTADILFSTDTRRNAFRLYDNYLIFKTASANQYSTLNLTSGAIGDFITSTGYFNDSTGNLVGEFNSLLYDTSTSRYVCTMGSGLSYLNTIYTIDSTDHMAKNLRYMTTASGSPLSNIAGLKQVGDANATIFSGFGLNNKLLYSSNKGVTWAELTISGMTTVYDIAYYSSRYVAVGIGSTGNYFHSTDLATWTAGTISSVGTTLGSLYVSGTKLLVGNATNFVYYSSNGTSWTASASNVGSSRYGTFVRNGTTTYLFKSTSSAPYRVNKYTSTDDGVTWGAASVVTNIVGSTSTSTLRNFESYGSKWYCLFGENLKAGTNNQAVVLETSDFTTFTNVPISVSLTGGVPMSLHQVAGSLRLAVPNTSSIVGTYGPSGITMLTLKSTTPDYVGTFGEVSFNNQIGYVRLS